MGAPMKGQRLQAHVDMKRRVMEILDGLPGDIRLDHLRGKLLISPGDVMATNVLKKALTDLRDRDHKAVKGRFIGWWKSAAPMQQPLPVAPPLPVLPVGHDAMVAWLKTLPDLTLAGLVTNTSNEALSRLLNRNNPPPGGML